MKPARQDDDIFDLHLDLDDDEPEPPRPPQKLRKPEWMISKHEIFSVPFRPTPKFGFDFNLGRLTVDPASDKIPIECISGKLSMKDDFGIVEFLEKLNTDGYTNTVDILNDLKRLFVIYNSHYLLKRKAISFDEQVVKYVEMVNEEEVKNEILSQINPLSDGKSQNYAVPLVPRQSAMLLQIRLPFQ
jgi:hypothetical protein